MAGKNWYEWWNRAKGEIHEIGGVTCNSLAFSPGPPRAGTVLFRVLERE